MRVAFEREGYRSKSYAKAQTEIQDELMTIRFTAKMVEKLCDTLRNQVEEVLTECLSWTCNGFCDGGDLGSGEMNLYCLVLDPDAAKNTLVSALKKNHLLKGAVIAKRQRERYRVLWPEDFQGAFRIV